MNKNVGPKDRIVRVVIAIMLVVLLYVGDLGRVGEIVVGLAAAYLLITALLRSCLGYQLAGVDTNVQAQEYSTTDDRAGLSD